MASTRFCSSTSSMPSMLQRRCACCRSDSRSMCRTRIPPIGTPHSIPRPTGVNRCSSSVCERCTTKRDARGCSGCSGRRCFKLQTRRQRWRCCGGRMRRRHPWGAAGMRVVCLHRRRRRCGASPGCGWQIYAAGKSSRTPRLASHRSWRRLRGSRPAGSGILPPESQACGRAGGGRAPGVAPVLAPAGGRRLRLERLCHLRWWPCRL
mmetsp:Transcript_24602/g.79468  ORF Transcript_24602/g.79468 Transcript_24602/m.79468 type:complete len:207 (-) Transcript_24602:1237-1857(-)